MDKKTKICDCGICFESINTKSIDSAVQFECGHYFHNSCVKPWCKKCIEDLSSPTCPLCRQTISNEYLDILNIDSYSNNISSIEQNHVMNLFSYIVFNWSLLNKTLLLDIILDHPEQLSEIIPMLQSYFTLINNET